MTNLRPRTPQQVLAAGLIVLATITAVAYLAGLGPLVRAKSARAARADEVLSAQADCDRLADEFRVADAKSADLAGAIQRTSVTLLPATALNARLQEIVALLARHGLVIETQQQDAPDYSRQRFGTLPIRIKARGTYQQCAALLHALNEQYKDLGVDSFELSGNPSESQRPLSFTLGLVWYVATPPAGH